MDLRPVLLADLRFSSLADLKVLSLVDLRPLLLADLIYSRSNVIFVVRLGTAVEEKRMGRSTART